MANAIYPKAKEQFLQGGINLLAVDVRFAIIDTVSYSYSNTDQFLSDVSGVVAVSPVLTSKSVFNGQFSSSSSVVFTAVSGPTSEALVLYVDTGVAATSRLIAFIDTGVTGLPITPNSNDITLAFGLGNDAIFTI